MRADHWTGQNVIHVQAEEVFHGILVFVSIQAADHGFRMLTLHLSDCFLQVGINPFGDDFALFRGKGFLVFGRHFSQFDLIRCVVPGFRRPSVVQEVGGQKIQAQISLCFSGPWHLMQ